jgi:hypothetical protein
MLKQEARVYERLPRQDRSSPSFSYISEKVVQQVSQQHTHDRVIEPQVEQRVREDVQQG